MNDIGIVVIGRNEGERLRRCLRSLPYGLPVVYVDSASSDGSVSLARSLGAEVVELDPSRPLSAARARNEGYHRLVELHPELGFVQFLDGDCELRDDWLDAAVAALYGQDDAAIVAGRLTERFPQASIYNRLGELEWNLAGCGEVEEVGGIFMIRKLAFESVNGFDPSVPAGEEPELCLRLRTNGWKIRRLDRDMAWHDLGITRFGQWWRRQVRTGHGSMDVAERFALPAYRRITLRARIWAAWAGITACAAAATAATGSAPPMLAAVLLLALWPMQLLRIALNTARRGLPPKVALAYAWLTMISYCPQLLGQARYVLDRRAARSAQLIEYK
jgi:glycosyltransferase involved in cell wall biosynthesis